MFEQLKNFVISTTALISTSEAPADKKGENNNELIQLFTEQAKELLLNTDLPQKLKPQIESIIFHINEIEMISLPIETQVKIERILSKDIPAAVESYLSLPKAHAVSVILENGKTAKQTLIDQFAKYSDLLLFTLQEAVDHNSKMLVENEKINVKVNVVKKDFFDL